MTWSTPLTAVSNAALTAAQWNASVRDNLLEVAPAKATTAGYHFVSTGTNAIAERAILAAEIDTSETTTSTTYADLATVGPSVTITTGTQALVWLGCSIANSGANFTAAAVSVSGASTLAADGDNGVSGASGNQIRAGACWFASGLTAGSNTFKLQYRVTAGTGTFVSRTVAVMAL